MRTDISMDGLRDHFLLAMPSLTEGIFAHSITYLCEHNAQGAMGLVINHPLELSVADVMEHLQIEAEGLLHEVSVMAGGPVQLDCGFVLHRHSEQDWEATMQVSDEISLTTSRDILTAIANGKGPGDHLITLGYAGWSPGQLEAEIADNSWLTLAADSAIIFDTPCEQRLTAAAAILGVDYNLMSGQAGHA
jgi:putative transcriptional regulator